MSAHLTREEIRKEGAALRDQARELLRQRPDLTSADLAQFTNLSDCTVRNWIAGQLDGGENLNSEVRRVLDQVMQGDILRPGGEGSIVLTEDPTQEPETTQQPRGTFYETQTVRRIGEVLDYCAEKAVIGVCTAGFGVGKTEAIRAWRRKNSSVDSIVIEFDEFSSTNKVETIRAIAEALGTQPRAINTSAAGAIFHDVCNRLNDHPALLIFDQCETLRPRICQVLRQIWDRTHEAGTGMAMLAAPILLSRLTSGRIPDLEALQSRVAIYAPLNGLTRREMAAIIRTEGIADVEDAAFALWYRACGGSMRRLIRSIDLLKAKHAGKVITEKTVTGVSSMLWGMSLQRSGL